MKYSFFYVGLICLILSLSCCRQSVKPVSELIEIRIDPDKVEKFIDISPMLSDSIDIIPLETTDECLLSNIERLTFYKGYFYILDGTSRNIFVFDEAGRFVRTVGKQGGGPGEYSAISFFDIMGDSIFISSRLGFRCIIYDRETNDVIHYFTSKVSRVNGFCLNGNAYFITNYEKVEEENFNLCKLDLATGKVVDKFIPFDEKLAKYSNIGLMNGVSKYKDSVYVTYPYNDTIYQITETGVIPLYKVHFTTRNPPDDLQPIDDNYARAAAKGGFVRGLEYIQISKDYIWGMYPDKGRFRFVCINRHTLETQAADGFMVNKLGYLSLGIPYIADGDLISVQSTSFLSEVLKSLLSEYAPTEEKYRGRLKELQENLKEDSNPVLFRYRLKEVGQ